MHWLKCVTGATARSSSNWAAGKSDIPSLTFKPGLNSRPGTAPKHHPSTTNRRFWRKPQAFRRKIVMPENNFVALKRELKRQAKAAGKKLPDRLAHRVAQGIMLERFAIQEANRDGEARGKVISYTDSTGEKAIANVLVAKFIAQYRAEQENGPDALSPNIRTEAA